MILASDDESPTVQAVEDSLRQRGVSLEVVPRRRWPDAAKAVGEAVASGNADMGVLFCWTGTGTSMMANKVPGVRAALCWEPWIAEGARKWNDANVLVMSLKRTTPDDAIAILDAWMSVGEPDPHERENIESLKAYDSGR